MGGRTPAVACARAFQSEQSHGECQEPQIASHRFSPCPVISNRLHRERHRRRVRILTLYQ